MTERKKTLTDQSGNLVEGTVVEIAESIERFSEVKLADGTILKTKMSAIEATRIDDQWDKDGNPIYLLQSSNIVAIAESPELLKRSR